MKMVALCCRIYLAKLSPWQRLAPAATLRPMSWLLSLDTAIFRFINERLNNPFLDAIMPQFAGNAWFIPLLIVLAGWLVWKGGPRGRLLLLMLVVVIALGDGFVINTIKRALLRPRPYTAISDVVLSPAVGKGGSGSMPSSHTSTWFAATLIALVYYRRSWRFMLPLAGVMAFSRVYLGVHYPSDVLVGAILGAGYAAAGVWTLDYLWCHAGRHWFPIWWSRLPSLVTPTPAGADTQPQFTKHEAGIIDLQWLRLGYLVIAVLFITRLFLMPALIKKICIKIIVLIINSF